MSKFGWNYPPGAANDPRAPWNEVDHTHEHRWEREEFRLQPIIEDGAAIFTEKCTYKEGRYGDGWECEETRTYRFEYSTVDVGGSVVDLPTIDDWDEVDEEVACCVMAIKKAYHEHGPGDKVSIDVDPDPDNGVVTIEWNGYELKYEPQ